MNSPVWINQSETELADLRSLVSRIETVIQENYGDHSYVFGAVDMLLQIHREKQLRKSATVPGATIS